MKRSRLRAADLVGLGFLGLRTRPGRTVLTALGIAIGIGAMVAVVGIGASSRADLLAQLDDLGTNLLEVSAGSTFFGDEAELPEVAPAMLERIGPVQGAAAITTVPVSVHRSDHIPATETRGITVVAVEIDLAATLQAQVADGRWLTPDDAALPTVVLGTATARALGITDVGDGVLVWLGGRWFTVVGILEPVALAPWLDRTALVGWDVAQAVFDTARIPSTVYLRADPAHLDAVADVAPATANPEAPNEVDVTRPSDALAARAAVDSTLTALLLGLGGVALLVGAIGIANVMVIAVLERTAEIGVRRALGASRSHVRRQFVVESTLLAFVGGVVGVIMGTSVTAVYAGSRGWAVDVPAEALAAGLALALVVGALSGVYPAQRAARLDPAEAVRGTG